MSRSGFLFSILLLFTVSSAFGEQVKQKFGVGLAAGLQRTLSGDVFLTSGVAYSGDLRFGLTNDFEIGLAFSYESNQIAYNMSHYFCPIAYSGTGGTSSDFPWRRMWKYDQPYDDQIEWRTLIISDKSEQLPIKFTYMPLDLFFKFRSLSKTIFNPYLVGGFGMIMWEATDLDGNALDVFWFDDYYDSTVYSGDTTNYRYSVSGGEWQKFKANQLTLLLGIGFEVFPISNVGIDVGLRGHYLFPNNFVDQVTDTMRGDVQATVRLNFYYGGVKDSDKDGVVDSKDKCPDTPFGATVDEFGCPMDSDQDGVPDGLDMCPNTPIGAVVDATGCSSDEDGDGVPDGLDKCPGTPYGAQVNPDDGCPLDSDGDGVADHEDACPNTPKGAYVDANGCPFDSDMDGVYDGIDKCPNTAMGAQVNEFGCERAKADSDGDGIPDDRDRCPGTPPGAIVDEFGCPKDTDGDGVADYQDACPRTPKGAYVDANGCPMDGDMDGVYDGLDKCPSTQPGARVDSIGCAIDKDDDGVPDGIDQCPRTPKHAEVDAKGCPKDSDGDGVYDGIDKCPKTPEGMAVDTLGCPKVKKLKKGESITVRIHFDVCSWEIFSSEAIKLQDALNMLRGYPDMIVVIEGHTDSQSIGPACQQKGVKDNVDLSFKRAESVRQWLMSHGVDGSRLQVKGYGETKPVAPNDTPEGRAKNRRIELRCIENCPGE
ncbi:OmpA family protein [bacterium]|nr:OmpA family protein [bacterium]